MLERRSSSERDSPQSATPRLHSAKFESRDRIKECPPLGLPVTLGSKRKTFSLRGSIATRLKTWRAVLAKVIQDDDHPLGHLAGAKRSKLLAVQ